MRVFFNGSESVKASLSQALKGYADVLYHPAGIKAVGDVDICIAEVSDNYGVTKVPATDKPVFLYINTRDKAILDMVKNLRIAGIFQPSVDAAAFVRKAQSIIKSVRPAAGTDFEKTKVKILAKAESVPMLPSFVNKLIALTSGDSATIEELSAEIKKDQGISGRVIRMVNSPFFGLRQNINSIDRAVVLLGFHTLKNIALAAASGSYYNKQFHMYKTTGAALWNHAYTVALIAEMLASKVGLDPDSMYLAGLFHDIGKTVMVDFLVQEVGTSADERAQLGMDHAEVAWLITRRWQLPEDICNAVRYHHQPDESTASQILYYANRFARVAKFEGGNMLGDNKALDLLMEELAGKYPMPQHEAMTKELAKLFEAASEVQI